MAKKKSSIAPVLAFLGAVAAAAIAFSYEYPRTQIAVAQATQDAAVAYSTNTAQAVTAPATAAPSSTSTIPPAPSATLPASPVPSPTVTETLVPTITFAPTPTITLAPTATNTPTATFLPGALMAGCIASPWSSPDLASTQNCLDPGSTGITPVNNGFTIQASPERVTEKVTLQLPVDRKNIKAITFDLKLTNMVESYEGKPTLLYFGLAAGEGEAQGKGYYLMLDKSTHAPQIFSSYLEDIWVTYTTQRHEWVPYQAGTLLKVSFIFNDKTFFIKQKNGGYHEMEYPWTKMKSPTFIVQYQVDPGGQLAVEVTNFHIQTR